MSTESKPLMAEFVPSTDFIGPDLNSAPSLSN
jgi:hypothetical protein